MKLKQGLHVALQAARLQETLLAKAKLDIILPLILINAFLMRGCGLEYGLPYIYSDESVFIVPATRMLLVGDMNPHWFGHPGSFLMYVLAGFFGLLTVGRFIYLFITGQVHSFSDFRAWFTPEIYRNELRPFYYYNGRLFTVVLSLVLIVLTYRLGKKLFGKPVGLLAAFCLSIAPLNICVSRMVRTDILGALLVVLVILFLIRYLDFPQKRLYLVLASLFAGFSAATKYTIAAVFIPVLLCGFREDTCQRVLVKARPLFYWLSLKRNFAWACLWAFFGFFISAPFVFLDFRHAIKDILFENSSSWLGIQKLPWLMKYWWYLSEPLRIGIGGLFFEGFALWGVYWILRERSFKYLIFLAFPLFYLFGIGFGNLRMPGWVGPVLPFEAICFGVGFCSFCRYLVQKVKTNRPNAVLAVCVVALLFAASLPVIVSNYREGFRLRKPDSRTVAKEWIDQNLPVGSKIAYEDYAPRLDTLQKRNFILMDMGWDSIASKPITYYEDQNVNFIIITNAIKSRHLKEPDKYRSQVSRYKDLEQHARLIKIFEPGDAPGPTIEIYQLKGRDSS